MRDARGIRRFGLLSALAVVCSWALAAAVLPSVAEAEPIIPVLPRSEAVFSEFSDVQGDEWYAEAAKALAARAVMLRQYSDSFDAEGAVTRGEMAYYLARALGLEEYSGLPFSDVQAWDWLAGSVATLHALGLIQETDSVQFSPWDIVTRQEAAAMIMTALTNVADDQTGAGEAVDQADAGPDVAASGAVPVAAPSAPAGTAPAASSETLMAEKEAARWLKGFRDRKLIDPANAVAVASAWRLGILDAPEDDQFFPADPLTRAELASMLYRTFLGPVADMPMDTEGDSAGAVMQTLEVGAKGALVSFLESRLTELHYPCGPVDGVYDYRTRDAVIAFQKVEGLERTGRMTGEVWEILAAATTPEPSRSGKGTRCEVDLGRQVLFMITDNEVTKAVHVSTGKNGTRTGRYRIEEKYKGWIDCITVNDYMYYPSYVVDKTAVHGYPNIPTYPASHGCVRTPVWITEEIFEELRTGTRIDIFR